MVNAVRVHEQTRPAWRAGQSLTDWIRCGDYAPHMRFPTVIAPSPTDVGHNMDEPSPYQSIKSTLANELELGLLCVEDPESGCQQTLGNRRCLSEILDA
jgi:hypothetical protein